jgi:hypothetical protein
MVAESISLNRLWRREAALLLLRTALDPSNISAMRSAIVTSAGCALAGHLGELRGDLAPRWPGPPIGRQVPHQFPHVGQRRERDDIGDNQRR